MMNPLVSVGCLPEFNRVEAHHVVPGVKQVVKELEKDLLELECFAASSFGENGGDLWEALVHPFERILDRLTVVWGIVSHLKDVKDSDALRAAVDEAQPLRTNFLLRLGQSKALYQAFEKIRNGALFDTLNEAQQRVVEGRLKDAILNGVALEHEKKVHFNEIQQELEKLLNKFSENVLDSTKLFGKLVTDISVLEGLPETALALAAQAAVSNGYEGANAKSGPWLITLDSSMYSGVMRFARNRDLREEVYRADITVASGESFDNFPVITRILELRQQKAELLGCENHAQVSMLQKMATLDSCHALLEKLHSCSRAAAIRDMRELEEFVRSENSEEDENLFHWDIPYWTERFREAKLDMNDEELRPYFSMPNVMDGLFSLAKRLFGVHIEELEENTPVWDKEVKLYKVAECASGENLGYFYLDPFSRPHQKRSGNWMGVVFNRSHAAVQKGGGVRLPVAHIVCNQAPPLPDQPSLMTFYEVTMLFHEFGHALQHLLSKQDEGLVAGSEGIEWDAVEIPSQFMENWCYDRNTLMSFAVHYRTGQELPEALYTKLKSSRTFFSASNVLYLVSRSLIDLKLHAKLEAVNSKEIYNLCNKVAGEILILPPLPEDKSICKFLHLFATTEYAAGYYSYLWSEVLSSDAFGAFEEAGLENETAVKEAGKLFKQTILELGGGRAPAKVFEDFRGRGPSINALLRHRGLVRKPDRIRAEAAEYRKLLPLRLKEQ
ncbi:probable cytosolic oligopeptidase A [Selaginella moellendorffii]|uniref:probable cytosolic oligopeptidase A n=1 Tax=Selaginella moellendorffii TaxID=88036 RepID=UPI000D1C817A|nr:probable cytosolic oligopeptidase A [Selaginella moellendorffii]|eukprot:XP_024533228.1 probable cytosolic oligopeptidase A [Selaginella moellendorffii]